MNLQKAYRIARRSDFQLVYKYGKSTASRGFVLYTLKKQEVEHFRLGISVSKKVGNAVVRNRMRRVIKEIVRSLAPQIVPHYDMVSLCGRPLWTWICQQLRSSVIHVMRRASMLKRERS